MDAGPHAILCDVELIARFDRRKMPYDARPSAHACADASWAKWTFPPVGRAADCLSVTGLETVRPARVRGGSARLLRMSVTSQSRLLFAAVSLAAVVIGLCGCGGTTDLNGATTAHAKAARAALAYRVGQYCVTSSEARDTATDLVCKRHHLARH